jgi:hypothetical protein
MYSPSSLSAKFHTEQSTSVPKGKQIVDTFIARQADTLQSTELLPEQTCVFFKISYQKSLVSH